MNADGTAERGTLGDRRDSVEPCRLRALCAPAQQFSGASHMFPHRLSIGALANPPPPAGNGAMARYYFDIQVGSLVAIDTEGEDHPSLQSARAEAAQVAALVGRDRL